MKLRAPAYPLVTIDPYCSLWSMADRLNEDDVKLWTGRREYLTGCAVIDGTEYAFMGNPANVKRMEQKSVAMTAFTTKYVFEAAGIRLNVSFTTPALPDDLEVSAKPISYCEITAVAADGNMQHQVAVSLTVSEELCREEGPVVSQPVGLDGTLSAMKIGTVEQPVLGCSGDNNAINWGYVYLAVSGGRVEPCQEADLTCVKASKEIVLEQNERALFVIAYDDLYSIVYFGEKLKAYWKKDGTKIEQIIENAFSEYDSVFEKCAAFDRKLRTEAEHVGGEQYADLLILSVRQVMAAHKAVLDTNGNLLYVSKECSSNGCAATVDVSYPSIPMFLIYNPELVKGMMRPILRYAKSDAWSYEFAPHDTGRYPILNGQFYSGGTDPRWQMPIEECGNMLLMMAAVVFAQGDASFAKENMELLEQWASYLLRYGLDPENQLCTDDFAGHLAHNCNLSLKAIMALAAYSELCAKLGEKDKASEYRSAAENMAKSWLEMAANGDGSYRLTFDKPDTFSLKYNMVWDKVMGLGLFSESTINSEVESYFRHMRPYGIPLDCRADYTKSDWQIWTATLAKSKALFEKMIAPLWTAYHFSPSRVPMTDWYSAVTSLQCGGFRHRTVQGGLFMKLLDERGIVKAGKTGC